VNREEGKALGNSVPPMTMPTSLFRSRRATPDALAIYKGAECRVGAVESQSTIAGRRAKLRSEGVAVIEVGGVKLGRLGRRGVGMVVRPRAGVSFHQRGS